MIRSVSGTSSEKKLSAPFIISTELEGKEIVYGSVSSFIFKIDALIDRLRDQQQEADRFLNDRNIKPLKEERQHDGIIVELPGSKTTDLFLLDQEEKLEEIMFLMSIYLRLLIEIFGDAIDEKLTVYDYEGNRSSNQISMRSFIGMFVHHRYFVTRGEYVAGIFSDKKQLPSSKILGSKVRISEFFDAVR